MAQELDGQLYYYLHNAHSDVVQRVNAQGTVLRAYDYNAFGNERERDKTDANPFRYCGEYFDAETCQVYLRARYYEPRTGRFTSEDPAKSGLNEIFSDTSITNSQVYQNVYSGVVNSHGPADASLAAYAKATGYEAVTMEKRLFNYLTETSGHLEVPIRRVQ